VPRSHPLFSLFGFLLGCRDEFAAFWWLWRDESGANGSGVLVSVLRHSHQLTHGERRQAQHDRDCCPDGSSSVAPAHSVEITDSETSAGMPGTTATHQLTTGIIAGTTVTIPGKGPSASSDSLLGGPAQLPTDRRDWPSRIDCDRPSSQAQRRTVYVPEARLSLARCTNGATVFVYIALLLRLSGKLAPKSR
jgi:hypothetical protein